MASVPANRETCVGSPWQICWGSPNLNIFASNTISVKTTNGRTYDNIQIALTAAGGAVPPIYSAPNCTASAGTTASGCTIYPNTAGVFTGIIFTDLTEGQYVLVSVTRKNADGTLVNLVQTRVGPLANAPG